MRLALKLLGSLALVTVLALGLAALADQRRQKDLLALDAEVETRLAVTLRAVVDKVCELAGPESAKSIIATVDKSLPARSVRWLGVDEIPRVPGQDLPATVRAHMATGEPVWVHFPNDAGTLMRYMYIPVAHGGVPLGAIEVSESMARRQAWVWRTQAQTAAVGLGVLLLAGTLAAVLGTRLVGRPVAALAESVRALGEGHFVRPAIGHRNDELGALANELSTLSDRLAARERLRHDDRLRTIGQLASGVAHELGTPLSVIAVRARLIASGEASGAETTANAAAIIDQAERMTALIRQLLDYSRRGTGHATDVDLGQAGLRTVEMLEPIARSRGVSLVVAADDATAVHADDAQLQQVLTNLVLNAIQAMPAGGRVEIRAGRGAAAPPGTPGPSAERCWVRVADEGPGIAPEDLARIFEPFYTTKTAGDGTGLGLAVAQAIVEEHGGWIDVASQPGRGATFTVYLPPAAAARERLAS